MQNNIMMIQAPEKVLFSCLREAITDIYAKSGR